MLVWMPVRIEKDGQPMQHEHIHTQKVKYVAITFQYQSAFLNYVTGNAAKVVNTETNKRRQIVESQHYHIRQFWKST